MFGTNALIVKNLWINLNRAVHKRESKNFNEPFWRKIYEKPPREEERLLSDYINSKCQLKSFESMLLNSVKYESILGFFSELMKPESG